jgi:hypothetical protein
MLRDPQHERKIINDFKSSPFVTSIDSVQALSYVEGLREGFLPGREFPRQVGHQLFDIVQGVEPRRAAEVGTDDHIAKFE